MPIYAKIQSKTGIIQSKTGIFSESNGHIFASRFRFAKQPESKHLLIINFNQNYYLFMPIRYVVQKRANPTDLTAPKKYYLIAKSLGCVTRKDFIEQMVLHTSLTPNEAATGLDYLMEALPRLLKMGFTVKLGELGYFKTTISSEGCLKESDISTKNVRNVRVRFVCGKSMRTEVKEALLEKFPEV